MRMTPKAAKHVHDQRERHVPYATIAKELDVKRSSMLNYYYKWLKNTGRKAWGS